MKILFWTDGFWPRLGGIETQSFEFIRGMQEKGHEYRVLAQKDLPNWKEEEIHRGISIRRFDFNAIIEKRDLKTTKSIQNYIEHILQEFQPDLIHLNTNVGGSLFSFLLFRKMFSMPTVLTCYAPYLYEEEIPLLVQKTMASVDQICCISDWVLNEVKSRVPSVANKLRRIYCGLAMPKITPAPLSFSSPTLLAFGRLSKEKGFDTVLQAFALLKKSGSDAQLILAGEGPQRKALERLALELGISVKFTGALSEEEVWSTFNQATLVIVPSMIESFGLVILEAMQMQRPVIASRTQGIPEVVSDQETGLLVPMRDSASFCHAIQTLLKHPEQAIKMGIEGRRRAMKFTLCEKMVQYEELYKQLVKGPV